MKVKTKDPIYKNWIVPLLYSYFSGLLKTLSIDNNFKFYL